MEYRSTMEYAMPRMQYNPSRNYTSRPPRYGQCQIDAHPGYGKK